jgi:hypothetical protein
MKCGCRHKRNSVVHGTCADCCFCYPAPRSKTATLVAGNAAALLLFAVIAPINHGEVLDWETFNTALPFMLGR